MPLHFGDEVITAYVKFNAKTGKWFTNTATGEIVEIPPPKMAIDLENLEVGWFRFREAQAPDIVIDPLRGEAPEPDGEGHKRGFRVKVHSQDLGVREFSSNSYVLKAAVKRLFDTWEVQNGAASGKLPVVEIKENTAIQGKYGVIYRPKFQIAGWVDRPEELPNANIGNVSLEVAQTAAAADDLDDEIPYS